MPTLDFAKTAPANADVDTLAVFATKTGDVAVPGADALALGESLEIDLAAELAALKVDGSLGSVARIPSRGKTKATMVLVIGAGETGSVTLDALRRGAGLAARSAAKDAALAVVVPADLIDPEADEATEAVGDADIAQAVAEGAGLGAYAYTAYRSKDDDKPSLTGITILAGQGTSSGGVKKGVATGAIIVRAVSAVRDLVNTPPQDKRPPVLAETIAQLAKTAGVKVKIHDEKALEKGGFGGLIGVGQGSSAPPRLVELTYSPARAKGHVVLVGKGITFDTGGISLKPSNSMTTMKSDMSGAAAVVGAITAAAELGVRVKITALCALAENMPSGTATRVSDVLTQRGGTTVEVMNTDAEGRLVLADALAYGAESTPDAMIDVATLTGAQVVALGNKVSGVLGTDDELVQDLLAAAKETGEGLWQLPLVGEYRDHLKSNVADMKNIGKAGEAGTIVAGLFLKEFTAGLPWAHLDIAGPAFTDEGDTFTTSRGATGVIVRTLVRYLQSRAA
jgi:leucyl aminopeptidase